MHEAGHTQVFQRWSVRRMLFWCHAQVFFCGTHIDCTLKTRWLSRAQYIDLLMSVVILKTRMCLVCLCVLISPGHGVCGSQGVCDCQQGICACMWPSNTRIVPVLCTWAMSSLCLYNWVYLYMQLCVYDVCGHEYAWVFLCVCHFVVDTRLSIGHARMCFLVCTRIHTNTRTHIYSHAHPHTRARAHARTPWRKYSLQT